MIPRKVQNLKLINVEVHLSKLNYKIHYCNQYSRLYSSLVTLPEFFFSCSKSRVQFKKTKFCCRSSIHILPNTHLCNTWPSGPWYTSSIRPSGHFPRGKFCSKQITASPAVKSLDFTVHFVLLLSIGNSSRVHLFQNPFISWWVRSHRLLGWITKSSTVSGANCHHIVHKGNCLEWEQIHL